jgi:hypothetical protein
LIKYILKKFNSNEAFQVTIPGPVIRPVQGWPPAEHRVGGLDEPLETLSKPNPNSDAAHRPKPPFATTDRADIRFGTAPTGPYFMGYPWTT